MSSAPAGPLACELTWRAWGLSRVFSLLFARASPFFPRPRRSAEGEGEMSAMATGTLKMWNAERGYGFIADDSGGPDMLLHISALQSAGIDPDNIRKGERLTFDVESTRDGKTRASNVRRSG
jgi:cold shock protein